jgi:dienelactone hydrolase
LGLTLGELFYAIINLFNLVNSAYEENAEMKSHLRSFVIALIVLLLAACSPQSPQIPTPTLTPTLIPTQTPTPKPILPSGVIEDLAYDEDSSEQTVTLNLPEGRAASAPVLFLLYGEYFPELVAYFTERGYPVISVSVQYDTFQVEMEDSFCALAFIHAESGTYGLDSNRIVTIGGSMAGGSAALLAALDDPSQFMAGCEYPLPETGRVAAVIALEGVFDYSEEEDFFRGFIGNITDYMAGTPEENPKTWETASAINHIDGSEPPFLLLHGTADFNVNQHQSEIFAARLEEAGLSVVFELLSGLGHGEVIGLEEAFVLMDTFLSQIFQ